MKRWSQRLILIALLCFGSLAVKVAAQDDDPIRQALIDHVASSEIFVDWLSNYPDYHVNAYGPDENGVWYIEFLNVAQDEWLGYANIDADNNEILDSFAPKPLPQDIYQQQLPLVTEYALADPEVLARLEQKPNLWDNYTDYNRWETVWDLAFYRGIEGIVVKVGFDENENPYIIKIVDPNQLTEDEALDNARNEAINLAYSADGIWDYLGGYDDWTTYAEPQGATRWSVTFVVYDKELFFALVDIQEQRVLAAEPGR
ncbi:MAG: hypothetical protein JNJ78_04200 [Anaerolineae bacterium]|nr:hypothetical protein [Anaerolineae bacterium]